MVLFLPLLKFLVLLLLPVMELLLALLKFLVLSSVPGVGRSRTRVRRNVVRMDSGTGNIVLGLGCVVLRARNIVPRV